MGTSEAVLEISRQTAYIEALSNTEQRRGTHCEGGEFLDISIPSSQARLLSKRLSIAFPKPPTTSAVNIAGLYAAAKELLSKLQAKVPKINHAKLIEVVYGSYETSKVMPLIVLKVRGRELVGAHTDEFMVHFEEFPAGFTLVISLPAEVSVVMTSFDIFICVPFHSIQDFTAACVVAFSYTPPTRPAP